MVQASPRRNAVTSPGGRVRSRFAARTPAGARYSYNQTTNFWSPLNIYHLVYLSSPLELYCTSKQYCAAVIFLGVSGSPTSQNRLQPRLRPNWVGSGSRQKRAAPTPALKKLYIQILFLIMFIYIN